ncbi:RTJK, partial [Enterospora canceri]
MDQYHIIGVTESWLDTSNRDYIAEFQLSGYTIFSCERENRIGGGVILYIHSSLHPISIKTEPINGVDTVFIELKNNASRKILGLIYRPPGRSAEIDRLLFESISETISQCETIIMGDFNLPVARWGNPLRSHTGHDLYTNLLESELHQHVHEPTRDLNTLDLILSTSKDLVSNVNVGPVFSSSDHRIITFNLRMKEIKVNDSKERVPNYQRANFTRMRIILEDTDWSELLSESESDIDKSWEAFTTKLNEAISVCVPYRYRRSARKNKPKWWNEEIKNSLSLKKHAYDKYISTKNQDDKVEFDRARSETKRLIKRSKKNLEEYIAESCKSNPKEFYSFVKSKKALTCNIGPLTKGQGNHTNDENEMATILNNFFASVFTEEDCSSFQPLETRRTENFLNNLLIVESDVVQKIDKMKTNKTPGPDKISPRILKEVKHQISKPLAIIFNKSLRNGKVPSDWKRANVTPIFKKGDKSQPGNYRPISLTSVVCKLMETIIRDNMVKFLEDNDIIKPSQHGFRNKRSCLTNLLDFFHNVFDTYDESRAVDVIYLDFQKAFDKVPHQRLLNKLKTHGISGSIYNWLQDWLSERKQRVVLNGVSSQWLNVKSGVPQGSVLGPILFLIYVNDIDDGISCKISKFADDTKIASKVTTTSDREVLQSDLDRLTSWANKWQMKFNVDKCKVLHIGRNNDHVQYSMNGKLLTAVNKEKDLGITISNDLKPSQHCSEVVKIANRLVGFIGRTFENKSEKVILKLHNSLVRPHLEYCVQFWSPYYRKDIDKLERVQRRITKMIPRLKNKPYEERLKELNLFSLEKRRMRGDLIEMFKIIKGFD